MQLLPYGRRTGTLGCFDALFVVFYSLFNFSSAPFSFAVSRANTNIFSQCFKTQRTFLYRSHYSTCLDTSANTHLLKAVYQLFFCFQNIYSSRYDSYGL